MKLYAPYIYLVKYGSLFFSVMCGQGNLSLTALRIYSIATLSVKHTSQIMKTKKNVSSLKDGKPTSNQEFSH